MNTHASDRLSLYGYYVFNNAHSDTAVVDSFPANPWNIQQDYGPAQFDVRDRMLIGGSYALPFNFRLSSILMANSGLPFSITLGQDPYGTGIHNARPAYATASTPPADMVVTQYGAFNISPGPLDVPIPPNTETGPANVMLNVRLSFGGEGGKAHGGQGTAENTSQEPHHQVSLGGRGLGNGEGFALSTRDILVPRRSPQGGSYIETGSGQGRERPRYLCRHAPRYLPRSSSPRLWVTPALACYSIANRDAICIPSPLGERSKCSWPLACQSRRRKGATRSPSGYRGVLQNLEHYWPCLDSNRDYVINQCFSIHFPQEPCLLGLFGKSRDRGMSRIQWGFTATPVGKSPDCSAKHRLLRGGGPLWSEVKHDPRH